MVAVFLPRDRLMSDPLASFERQLSALYEQAASTGEVAPAARYRLEGYAQALIAEGLVSRDAVMACVVRCYRDAQGAALEEAHGETWPGEDPSRVPVPWRAPRAPVWPTTRD